MDNIDSNNASYDSRKVIVPTTIEYYELRNYLAVEVEIIFRLYKTTYSTVNTIAIIIDELIFIHGSNSLIVS